MNTLQTRRVDKAKDYLHIAQIGLSHTQSKPSQQAVQAPTNPRIKKQSAEAHCPKQNQNHAEVQVNSI